MEFEHDTPRALANNAAGLFFFRVKEALKAVDSVYDVVIIDCPPQLGFLTMSALSAATGVLVTIHPEMLDVMSTGCAAKSHRCVLAHHVWRQSS